VVVLLVSRKKHMGEGKVRLCVCVNSCVFYTLLESKNNPKLGQADYLFVLDVVFFLCVVFSFTF